MINKYNEVEYAKTVINNGFQTKKKTYELMLIASYYRSQGMADKELEVKITEFCKKYLEGFNDILYFKVIQKVLKKSKSKKLTDLSIVPIAKSDLGLIETVDKEYRELFFTLIVLYKINMILFDNKYLSNSESDIKNKSKLTSYKVLREQTKYLTDNGLITLTLKSASIDCLFEDKLDLNDTNVVFNVTDFENIGLYYKNYVKGGYIHCEKCGRMCKKDKKRKYCKECTKYQPIKEKTFKCVDCGNEFETSGDVKVQLRCSECQKKERARINQENYNKRKQKNLIED